MQVIRKNYSMPLQLLNFCNLTFLVSELNPRVLEYKDFYRVLEYKAFHSVKVWSTQLNLRPAQRAGVDWLGWNIIGQNINCWK